MTQSVAPDWSFWQRIRTDHAGCPEGERSWNLSGQRGSRLYSPIADVFLEGDNKAFGKKSAEYIVDRLKGKGKIVILRGQAITGRQRSL